MKTGPALSDLFLILDGTARGPFRWDEVERLWESGTIIGETGCCREGAKTWSSLASFASEHGLILAPPPARGLSQEENFQSMGRWFVLLRTGPVGPYPISELEILTNQGLITTETLVCEEHATQWHPAILALPALNVPPPPSQAIHVMSPAPASNSRGCLGLLGCITVFIGFLCCLTFIGVPFGLGVMLVGGILIIAAK